MNQHTLPPGPVPASRNPLPWGRAKLVALEIVGGLVYGLLRAEGRR